MAFDLIRLGQPPLGAGGDDARTGFERTNNNFTEAQRQLDGKAAKEDVADKLTKVDAANTYQTKKDTADALAKTMPKNPGGDTGKFVRGDGSLGNSIGPVLQTVGAGGIFPMFEWHVPGITALVNYLADTGVLYWAGSTGGGVPVAPNIMWLTRGGSLTIIGNLGQGSDYRLKENISDLEPNDVLRRLQQLHLFEYDPVLDPDRVRSPGVLAHELQSLFPCLVAGEKDAVKLQSNADGEPVEVPDYQRVNYTGLTVYLAAGVQAITRRVEVCEQRIAELTKAVESLLSAAGGQSPGDID